MLMFILGMLTMSIVSTIAYAIYENSHGNDAALFVAFGPIFALVVFACQLLSKLKRCNWERKHGKVD